ncbi:MAG: UDP-N-acetylmuramoylalanyl-D-glutamate--2,6-diaminopimelate ligase [Rhodoferax sp.]|nr:UDP-N-acetylmuramoylalanyl-D-glutamate--2,6-diaminopimelate ligase [Rhodoferax sp.]
MSYVKPWLNMDQQLDQLQARGLNVSDREKALHCLQRMGYYRLSGYWFAFRERSGPCCSLDKAQRGKRQDKGETLALDRFKKGATFQHAVDLYVFDKGLRLLVTDALERVEVALRVDLSHTLGRLDSFAYLRAELFHGSFSQVLSKDSGVTRHHEWLGKHAQLILRSKEEFVSHNRLKYGLPLAVWVACEVWDFGTLSTLFGGMREAEQDAISTRYGISNGRVFASWLRSLNYLRNVCAHHSRLWNRNIVDQPKLPSAAEMPWVAPFVNDAHALARCFLLLRMTRHLLGVINPASSWPQRLKDHLMSFPKIDHLGLNLGGMGMVLDWETQW